MPASVAVQPGRLTGHARRRFVQASTGHAGQVTPFSLAIPYDEHSRIEVLFTRPGYKVTRRSLMPISSENINVSLQADAASVPDPVSKRKNPRIGPIKLAPAKPIPPATSAGDELKDEPNFGSASDPSRGPR